MRQKRYRWPEGSAMTDTPDEDEMLILGAWTTGRAPEQDLVALAARTKVGLVALAMTPQQAIDLGEELAAQGLRMLAERGRGH